MQSEKKDLSFFQDAFHDFKKVMFLKDTMGRYVFTSRQCGELFEEGSILGKTELEVQTDPQLGARYYKEDLQILASGKGMRTLDRVDTPSGPVYFEVIREPVLDKNGAVVGISGVADDVTELVQYKKKFEQLSLYDSLTHAYSRHYTAKFDFDDPRHLPCSYIMCDCNDLKQINDQQGHAKGDEYLCQAADVLRRACLPRSILVRWGGDEFLLITPSCSGQEHQSLLERIEGEQNTLRATHPHINIAVGGALRTGCERSEASVIQQADQAMYQDKAARKKEKNQSGHDRA